MPRWQTSYGSTLNSGSGSVKTGFFDEVSASPENPAHCFARMADIIGHAKRPLVGLAAYRGVFKR